MMKLSEAVRLGPTIVPTIHGPVFKRDWYGRICGACRIGSIALAAGYEPKRVLMTSLWSEAIDSQEVYKFIHKTWPWVEQVSSGMPLQGNVYGVVSLMVFAHEIDHRTVEDVAKMIEVLEAKYDPQPVTMNVTPNVAGDATQLLEVL